MGIVLEFIPSILVALAFDFFLYLTGTVVLKIASFGLYKSKVYSYSEFKDSKSNSSFLIQYLVGILFYALIIFLIAWLN
ncbi:MULTISPECIES: hypothetical protein [unclassified Pseudoalteromonas]|uniref:hypothetical protein n=1 Tax=unclassified Pseudoalteromonas TaxID=194690 RepID=UPI00332CEEBC